MAARSILITGASSGIGEAAARRLRAEGWQVLATARRAADLERLAAAGLTPIELELASPDSVDAAAERVLDLTGGRLDALFNNAGYGQPGAVEDLPRQALQHQFEVNVFGPAQLTNRLLPAMRRQGHGRIVVNSSVLGLVALPMRGAYNASKFALEGLCDTLRLELYGSGIHVSLIEPGPIVSRFRANAHRHFLAHIDRESSPHAAVYAAMEARLTRPGPVAPFTLPAEAVVRHLRHALNSPRPRPRYYVTLPTYLLGTLRRLLGSRTLDRVLRRISRGEQR